MCSHVYVMTFEIFNVCQLNLMINQSEVGDNQVSTKGQVTVLLDITVNEEDLTLLYTQKSKTRESPCFI